jgi:putative ABC transport system permease protein
VNLIVLLGTRNLLRNPRRSIITGVAVAVGVAVLIFGWGFVGGLDENIVRGEEDTRTGHVLLKPADYSDESYGFPAEDAKPLDDALTQALAGEPVVSFASRLLFDADVVKGPDRVRVAGLAYDPVRDPVVFPRDSWGLEGRWPEAPTEVVVAKGLAEMLEIEVGSNFIVQARTAAGAINALSYTVSGIVQTRNAVYDGTYLWLPLQTAETLLAVEGVRSHIGVRLQRRAQATAAAAALSSSTWVGTTATQEAQDKLTLNVFRKRAIGVVVFILMAIAGTGIANTVSMAAYERVKEIGTLRAMGFGRNHIRMLFLVEGALMGLVSAFVGAVLGSALVSYFSINGIDLGDVSAAGGAVGSTMLYLQLSWSSVVYAVAFGVGISLLASTIPANFAANLNPADAVRDC